MTYPVKYVTLIVFAAPLLAAFSLARWRSRTEARPQTFVGKVVMVAGVLLLLIGAILFWAWRWPFPQDDFSATLGNGLGRAAMLVTVVVVLLALGRATRASWQRILPVALLLVLWLDVWTHEPNQNPSVPPWIYAGGMARKELAMNPQPTLGESRVMLSPAAETKFMHLVLRDPKDNFLAKRLGYFANCNLLDDVPKVNGFFSIYPREAGELNSVFYVSTNVCPPRLADFMSVSQLTTPGEYVKWTPRDTFLPLATAGQQPVFLDDTNALSFLIGPAFDGQKFVFLPPEARAFVSVTNQTRAQVVKQRFAAEQVELEVEAADPSLVVISQTYYHRWQAYVDDQPARLLRANYAFQAVEVPSGKHRVRLAYHDRALALGALISGVCLLACLAGWWLSKPWFANSGIGRIRWR